MRVLWSLIGWIVKFAIGVSLASASPLAVSSGFSLLAFGLINAIGLHVLLTALPHEYRVAPPKPVLIGLCVAGLLAIGVSVASALPANGCETCVANGNNWWYCFAVYGYYCL